MTDRAALRAINNAAEKAGVRLPKPVRDVQEAAQRIKDNSRALPNYRAELEEAMTRALLEDRDPAADAEVQRLTTGAQLRQLDLTETVERQATELTRDAFRKHADAILGAFVKPCDEAAAVLAKAREQFGDVALTDTSAILAAGADAAETWAEAKRAVETFDAYSTLFGSLLDFTGLATLNPNMRALRFAAVDLATWTRQGWGWGNGSERTDDPWSIARAGVPLSVPRSVDEYIERMAALDRTRDQEQARAEIQNRRTLAGALPHPIVDGIPSGAA
jgi:hypothetical protein